MIRFAENLNKMITAGLGGPLDPPRTEVAVGHCIRYLEASGPVASFETNIVASLKKLIVSMLPVQAGSGDPSPENVRPISGRDSVTVARGRKNLLDYSAMELINSTAENIRYGIAWTTPGTYTVSGGGGSGIAYRKKTADGTYGPVKYSPGVFTETIAEGDSILVFNITASATKEGSIALFESNKIQLEAGSSATAYEAPQIQSANIQLGQTVYGGLVDIASGEMTVEYARYSPDPAVNPSVVDIGDGWVRVAYGAAASRPEYAGYTPETGYYSHGRYATGWIEKSDHAYVTSTKVAYFWLQCEATVAAVKAYIASQVEASTPVELVYKIAEPFTIQLTPEQLTTLVGYNAVWSDAGDVDVTYQYYEETEGY